MQHLTQGRNIAEAKEFISKTKIRAKKVVLIVGSNDLDGQKSVSKTEVELDDLLRTTRQHMGSDVDILVSEVMPRTGRHVFNKKATDFNARVSRECDRTERLHFIPQRNIFDERNRYDNIHLAYPAVPRFVRNIKSVLNPLLGLRPITEYQPLGGARSRSREGEADKDTQQQQPPQRQWQQQPQWQQQQQPRYRGSEQRQPPRSDSRGSAQITVQHQRLDNGDEKLPVAKPTINVASIKEAIINALNDLLE